MMQERRDSERLTLSAPVRYQQKGSQRFGNTLGKDISASGIGFFSDEFFPVSTQLIFDVRHPKTHEFIRAIGEIVWIADSQPYPEKYAVGARFMGPPIPV